MKDGVLQNCKGQTALSVAMIMMIIFGSICAMSMTSSVQTLSRSETQATLAKDVMIGLYSEKTRCQELLGGVKLSSLPFHESVNDDWTVNVPEKGLVTLIGGNWVNLHENFVSHVGLAYLRETQLASARFSDAYDLVMTIRTRSGRHKILPVLVTVDPTTEAITSCRATAFSNEQDRTIVQDSICARVSGPAKKFDLKTEKCL